MHKAILLRRLLSSGVIFSIIFTSFILPLPGQDYNSAQAVGAAAPFLTQRGYIWENDDGTGVNSNTPLDRFSWPCYI